MLRGRNRAALSRVLAFVFACACASGCGSLPRDPEGTLRRVRGGRLRVGLVENPPWVVRGQGEPAGAEVELVKRMAAELGATPEWVWGGEQQHMEALERYELDLAVGGLTKETAWSKYVGLTSPYFEERVLVGVPGSTKPPGEVKGVSVAVKRGDAAAAYVRKEGGVPVASDDISQAGGPAAAADWKLEQAGFTLTDIELHTGKHVLATPPGENGWIKWLDEFLARQRPQVKGLLQQEEARR